MRHGAAWFGRGGFCLWLVSFGLVAAGCVSQDLALHSSALYEEGARYYLAGQYSQGASRLSRAALESEDPRLRARASLLEGRCHLAMRQFHQAGAAFRRGLKAGSGPKEVRAGLELGLADSLYGQERYREAADQYHRVLRHPPDLIPADEATFKLALAGRRAGLWEEARRQFARLASRFPRSPRADAARRYAAETARGFSVQCGAFSSADAARRLAGQLRGKGFTPRVVPITTAAGHALTAVRVGSFPAWAEAAQVRSRLQATGFDARIVP